jgi:hypothetical protein
MHISRLAGRLLAAALLCSPTPAVCRAQQPASDEPDFIVPARPTVSNPAEFQRPGVLQLEYGFDSDFRATGVPSAETTPLSIRFAVSRRLLVEFDSGIFVSQTAPDGPRTTGVSDQGLTLQGVLAHETPSSPGVAVAYSVKLPTASDEKGLGTGKFDHTVTLLVSKTLHGTTIDANAAYIAAGRQAGGGFASSGLGAVAASHGLGERFGIQGELSGSSRSDLQPGQMFALGAFTYQMNRRAVFDAGVRVGLTPDAARYGIFAGVTVGVADLGRFFRRER